MVLEKNAHIILNICKVQIRSTDNVVYIPTLSPIYHTPSKIQYTANISHTAHGNLHNKTLRLSYPGLSQTDFTKFDELAKGRFQIFVTLDNKDVYEIASERYPMDCTISFSLDNGWQLVFNVNAPLNITYIGTDTGKPGMPEQFDYDFDFNLA